MKSNSPFLKPFVFALVFILVVPLWMVWRGRDTETEFKTLLPEMQIGAAVTAALLGAWAYHRKKNWPWDVAFWSFIFSFPVVTVVIVLVAQLTILRHRVPPGVPMEGGLKTIQAADDVNTKMRKFAEQAVIDAWQFNGVLLDYTPSSVERVEGILPIRQKWCTEKKFTDKDVRAEAFILGAYIGEVIRREHGGSWSEDDTVSGPGSYPLRWEKKTSYPYGWCYKRLAGGPEENVWYKYLYFVRNETPKGVDFEITRYSSNAAAQLPALTNQLPTASRE